MYTFVKLRILKLKWNFTSIFFILDKPKDGSKQPEIPDGASDTEDKTDHKIDVQDKEKLPETPDGESGDEMKDIPKKVNQKKQPEIPVGKSHDEM